MKFSLFKSTVHLYEFESGTIRVVNNHPVIFGSEEVYLNDRLISSYRSSPIKFRSDSILINKVIVDDSGGEFHLKVKCGCHLGIIPRAHIYIDGLLVGGNVDKDIYQPSDLLFFVMSILCTWGVLFIISSSSILFKLYSKNSSIEEKVKTNSSKLWQKEIYTYFKEGGNLDLRKKKENEWDELCKKYEDHHCRLRAYLFSLNKDEKNIMKYSLKSCLKGKALSCYHVYLLRSFSINHKQYEFVTRNLVSMCTKSDILSDREKRVCQNFSRHYFKGSGNHSIFKQISTKLCLENYELGCHNEKVMMDI